jgi:tetratricopeptide (TPR) repeat protein
MRFFVISFFILLIISFSTGTLLRNQVWLTEESLWKDSVTKAPNTAKSYINLAHVYLNRGELEIAFELNKQALGKYSPTPWKNTLRSYHNMGNIMQDLRHYNDAIQYYDKALEEDPENIDVQYNKYLALQKNNSINEAFELINKLVDTNPENSTFLGALGKAYIMNGNNQLALHYFRLAMRNVSSNDTQKAIILLNIGTIYNNMENFDKAELYFDYGERVGASRLLLDLCSLEKCIRMENFAEAEIFFNSLLTNLTWPMLIQNLQKIQTWDFPVALNPIILKGYINKRVSELNSFPIYKN